MSQIEFDERVVATLEKVYATRDVVRRRQHVREALGAAPGERILDVGCGPGFYVAELLDEVGPDGSVVGVDASEASLAVAGHRVEGHGNVAFHQADATSLPVEDAEFDAALSVQVMEYVSDIAAALAELRRVVRPGGRVVIWDVDWSTVSMHTADRERMDAVLAAWDTHLADPVLPRTLTARLREAGFEDIRMEGHTFATNEFVPDAYGGFLVPFAEQFVTEQKLVEGELAKAWADEQRELGERGAFYFACIQFCFSARCP